MQAQPIAGRHLVLQHSRAGPRHRIEVPAGNTLRPIAVLGLTADLRRQIEGRAGRTPHRIEVVVPIAGLRRRIEVPAGRTRHRTAVLVLTAGLRRRAADQAGHTLRPIAVLILTAGLRYRIEVRAGRTRLPTEVQGLTADPRRRIEVLGLIVDLRHPVEVQGPVAQRRDRIATRNPDRAGSLPGVGAPLGGRRGLVKRGPGRVGLADARLSQQGRSALNGAIGLDRLRTTPAGRSVANLPCVSRNRLDVPRARDRVGMNAIAARSICGPKRDLINLSIGDKAPSRQSSASNALVVHRKAASHDGTRTSPCFDYCHRRARSIRQEYGGQAAGRPDRLSVL